MARNGLLFADLPLILFAVILFLLSFSDASVFTQE